MRKWLLLLAAAVGLTGPCPDVARAGPEEKGAGWDALRALVRTRFPKVTQLSTAELDAWLKDPKRPKPRVLDAREPAEFAVSHLAGAVRVSPDATAKEVLASLEAGRPIVIYCSVGYRSSRLAARLLESGRVSVSNLEGSIFQWANEGRPLVTPKGEATTKVHPFDRVYGRLLKPEFRAQQRARLIPWARPSDYPRIKRVHRFAGRVATPLADGVNALCWERTLAGDFGEAVEWLGAGEGIRAPDEARLRVLPVSAAGTVAVERMLADLRRLQEHALDPVLNCIDGDPREKNRVRW